MRVTPARVLRQFVILLVEDFKPLLLAMQNLLETCHYNVLLAGTPAEALFVAEQSPLPIDLLIARLLLPGMTGPALAAQIRAHAPNLAVLYMSDDFNPWLGGPSEPEIRASLLPTPFTDEILLDRVYTVLASHDKVA